MREANLFDIESKSKEDILWPISLSSELESLLDIKGFQNEDESRICLVKLGEEKLKLTVFDLSLELSIQEFNSVNFKSTISFLYQSYLNKLYNKLLKRLQDTLIDESTYWKTLKELLKSSEHSKIEVLRAESKTKDIQKIITLSIRSERDYQESFDDIFIYGSWRIFCKKDKQVTQREYDSTLIAFIDFLKIREEKGSQNEAQINLNQILNEIEYPVVIINNSDAISYYNENFSKLNVIASTVLKSIERRKITVERQDYSLLYNEHSGYRIIVFNPLSKENALSGGADLGIITGSIAHELNNPVAGILAAVTLLELEEWEPENQKLLKELKESGIRCKNLIDTFLGFTRTDLNQHSQTSLGAVIKQASSLVRSRVVESGVSIKIEAEDQVQLTMIKSSVLTMVLYLVFNELITAYLHRSLVKESNDKIIQLEFKKSNDFLEIVFVNFQLSSRQVEDFNHKLIDHLLDINKISFRVLQGKVSFGGVFCE